MAALSSGSDLGKAKGGVGEDNIFGSTGVLFGTEAWELHGRDVDILVI